MLLIYQTAKKYFLIYICIHHKNLLSKNNTFCHTEDGKLKYPNNSPVTSDIVIISDGSKSRIRREIFKDEVIRPVRENEVVNIIENKEIAKCIKNNFMKFHHEDGGLTFGILKLSEDKILWYSQFDNEKYSFTQKILANNNTTILTNIYAIHLN